MSVVLNDSMQEVLQAEEFLRGAMLSGDVSRLDELLSDDVVFTNQPGASQTKSDDLAVHRSGVFKVHRLDFADVQLRASATNVISTLTAGISGDYDGQAFDGGIRIHASVVSAQRE